MGKLVKEFTVAPNEKELKEAIPEVECISQALLNQWILKGICRPIRTAEFVLPTGVRYFKVWAEVEEPEQSAR